MARGACLRPGRLVSRVQLHLVWRGLPEGGGDQADRPYRHHRYQQRIPDGRHTEEDRWTAILRNEGILHNEYVKNGHVTN